MKTAIRSSFLALATLLFVTLAATASAASDYFLKIEGGKGAKQIVRCADGACTVSGLAPGQYMISVCDENGVDVPAQGTLDCAVVTAREASSGMATGKRMHKPFVITKEWDRRKPENQITVTEAGSSLKINSAIKASWDLKTNTK